MTISGNNISAERQRRRTSLGGIFLGPTAGHVGIFGNQIYNIGQGRTDGVRHFELYGANDVFVSGNYVPTTTNRRRIRWPQFMGARWAPATSSSKNSSDLPNTLTLASDTLVAGPAFGGGWKVTGTTTLNGTTLVGGNNIFQVGTGGDAIRLTPGPSGVDATIFTVGSAADINLQIGAQGAGYVILRSHLITNPVPINAANDAAALAAGVPLGGEYRNGSVKMVRVT